MFGDPDPLDRVSDQADGGAITGPDIDVVTDWSSQFDADAIRTERGADGEMVEHLGTRVCRQQAGCKAEENSFLHMEFTGWLLALF